MDKKILDDFKVKKEEIKKIYDDHGMHEFTPRISRIPGLLSKGDLI